MGPSAISWKEPPFHQLMSYVFSHHASLDPPCERDCGDCKKRCPECHRTRYQGWNNGNPRYDCPNIKKVYLQRNLACHVVQTRRVLEKTVLNAFSDVEALRATSLAGGPGVELLALADSLADTSVKKLRFVNFDIEATWKEPFTDLVSEFSKLIEAPAISSQFCCRDFSQGGTTKHQYDIAFVPWVLSELAEPAVPHFVESAAAACVDGGYVIVLERPEDKYRDLILREFGQCPQMERVHDNSDELSANCYVTFPDAIKATFGPKHDYHTFYFVFQKHG